MNHHFFFSPIVATHFIAEKFIAPLPTVLTIPSATQVNASLILVSHTFFALIVCFIACFPFFSLHLHHSPSVLQHLHLLILLLVDTLSVVCLLQCHLSPSPHWEVYALECCSFTRPLLVKMKAVGIYSDLVSTLRDNVLTRLTDIRQAEPHNGTF